MSRLINIEPKLCAFVIKRLRRINHQTFTKRNKSLFVDRNFVMPLILRGKQHRGRRVYWTNTYARTSTLMHVVIYAEHVWKNPNWKNPDWKWCSNPVFSGLCLHMKFMNQRIFGPIAYISEQNRTIPLKSFDTCVLCMSRQTIIYRRHLPFSVFLFRTASPNKMSTFPPTFHRIINGMIMLL